MTATETLEKGRTEVAGNLIYKAKRGGAGPLKMLLKYYVVPGGDGEPARPETCFGWREQPWFGICVTKSESGRGGNTLTLEEATVPCVTSDYAKARAAACMLASHAVTPFSLVEVLEELAARDFF